MESKNIIQRFAEKMNVDANQVLAILKATAFKQRDGSEPTNEQMMALLLVAHQYGLNPFTKEIFAFPDKQAGIIPVVGVDGWSRIINQHDQFDGMEFNVSDNQILLSDAKSCPEWMECIIYRKDRAHPIKVIEYLDEVYRLPFESKNNGGYKIFSAWQSHTKRMLRHKAMIQCARLAFGFVGIYDHDEAERIIERDDSIIDMEYEKLAPIDISKISERTQQLTQKLIERAKVSNAWNSAFAYCAEQFSGIERRYVENALSTARQSSMNIEHLSAMNEINNEHPLSNAIAENTIAPNADIHLLVDRSSSMTRGVLQGDTVRTYGETANLTALSLAFALEGIEGISLAVSFFGKSSLHPAVCSALRPKESVRANAGRFIQSPSGNTPMAEAIWFAVQDLLQQRGQRKIIIVITDGTPTHYPSTEEVIKRCHTTGIELVGIGIRENCVKALFEQAVVIEDVPSLKAVLFSVFTKSLAKSIQ